MSEARIESITVTGTRSASSIRHWGVNLHDESYATYKGFSDTLKERGIEKVDLVISDGHKGIKKVAASSFIGSSWQLCTVHMKRNLMKIVPKKSLSEVLGWIDDVLYTKDYTEAIGIAHRMIAQYEEKQPKLSKFLNNNLADAITCLAFPKRHHRKIHSINVLERFNKEVKRRTKVIGAFPSEGSALRLLAPLAVDTNAKWLDRKYVSWEIWNTIVRLRRNLQKIFDGIEKNDSP